MAGEREPENREEDQWAELAGVSKEDFPSAPPALTTEQVQALARQDAVRQSESIARARAKILETSSEPAPSRTVDGLSAKPEPQTEPEAPAVQSVEVAEEPKGFKDRIKQLWQERGVPDVRTTKAGQFVAKAVEEIKADNQAWHEERRQDENDDALRAVAVGADRQLIEADRQRREVEEGPVRAQKQSARRLEEIATDADKRREQHDVVDNFSRDAKIAVDYISKHKGGGMVDRQSAVDDKTIADLKAAGVIDEPINKRMGRIQAYEVKTPEDEGLKKKLFEDGSHEALVVRRIMTPDGWKTKNWMVENTGDKSAFKDKIFSKGRKLSKDLKKGIKNESLLKAGTSERVGAEQESEPLKVAGTEPQKSVFDALEKTHPNGGWGNLEAGQAVAGPEGENEHADWRIADVNVRIRDNETGKERTVKYGDMKNWQPQGAYQDIQAAEHHDHGEHNTEEDDGKYGPETWPKLEGEEDADDAEQNHQPALEPEQLVSTELVQEPQDSEGPKAGLENAFGPQPRQYEMTPQEQSPSVDDLPDGVLGPLLEPKPTFGERRAVDAPSIDVLPDGVLGPLAKPKPVFVGERRAVDEPAVDEKFFGIETEEEEKSKEAEPELSESKPSAEGSGESASEPVEVPAPVAEPKPEEAKIESAGESAGESAEAVAPETSSPEVVAPEAKSEVPLTPKEAERTEPKPPVSPESEKKLGFTDLLDKAKAADASFNVHATANFTSHQAEKLLSAVESREELALFVAELLKRDEGSAANKKDRRYEASGQSLLPWTRRKGAAKTIVDAIKAKDRELRQQELAAKRAETQEKAAVKPKVPPMDVDDASEADIQRSRDQSLNVVHKGQKTKGFDTEQDEDVVNQTRERIVRERKEKKTAKREQKRARKEEKAGEEAAPEPEQLYGIDEYTQYLSDKVGQKLQIPEELSEDGVEFLVKNARNHRDIELIQREMGRRGMDNSELNAKFDEMLASEQIAVAEEFENFMDGEFSESKWDELLEKAHEAEMLDITDKQDKFGFKAVDESEYSKEFVDWAKDRLKTDIEKEEKRQADTAGGLLDKLREITRDTSIDEEERKKRTDAVLQDAVAAGLAQADDKQPYGVREPDAANVGSTIFMAGLEHSMQPV